MPYTIQIGIYREARIGQTCIYHGIHHPDYCIYHGIYRKTGIYHGATIGPGSRQVVVGFVYTMVYTTMVYTMVHTMVYTSLYGPMWYIP
jgi:hypothetical protein